MSLTDNYGPVHPSAARGFFSAVPWPIIHFEKLLVLLEHVLNDPGPRPCLVFGIIEGNGNILLFLLKLALIRWQRFSEIRENNCCTIWAPDLRASKPYHPNRFMEIFVMLGICSSTVRTTIFLISYGCVRTDCSEGNFQTLKVCLQKQRSLSLVNKSLLS